MINETIPSDKELKETLHKLYPKIAIEKLDFRNFQKDAINTVLNGKDALVTVPTGGGKSVCYQVPAMHLPGVTLVVSPLLALMEDQVRRLQDKGFPVAAISSEFIADDESELHYTSQTNSEENKESPRKLRQGIYKGAAEGKYKLIYITPERLRNGRFIEFAENTKISMIAIDEAHCISMWGYEFRPRYLEISKFIKRIGYRPVIMALTATLTKSARQDIVKLLELKNYAEIDKSTKRKNLYFSTKKMNKKRKKLGCSNICKITRRKADLYFVAEKKTLMRSMSISNQMAYHPCVIMRILTMIKTLKKRRMRAKKEILRLLQTKTIRYV